MHLSLGSLGLRLPPQPPSDLLLLNAVHRGHLESSAGLYRRHYRAVHAYAGTCVRSEKDARALAEQAFGELLSGRRPPARRRRPHCVRLQLLDNVRTLAATGPLRWHGDLSVPFWSWAGLDEGWPDTEDGALGAAFDALPAFGQCLLWHVSVEQESPDTVSELVGLSPDRVVRDSLRVSTQLRRRWLGAHLAHLAEPACRRALRQLQRHLVPTGRRDGGRHLAQCTRCAGLWASAAGLDQTLASELPRHVLGWWPHDDGNARPLAPPTLPIATHPGPVVPPHAGPHAQDATQRPGTEGAPPRFPSPAGIALLALVLWTAIMCVMLAWPPPPQEESVPPTSVWITSQSARRHPAVPGQGRTTHGAHPAAERGGPSRPSLAHA
ncbi:hypothetical protein [Streptomyces sp. NBC_00648]|uniref:hypothetical protein n=1 Tax=Streptomyces sp. NBC_00648 TaxID=2975797 RepID=UPI003249DD4D